ncbi:tyrosine-type recombinase/integrase [Rhodopirellula europaea]|uniref:tyrosine-type recombinase/integrase n=1 Tax=Rhodopirellula europaea TaxID=1263866 RepID=UPI003D2CFD1E
MPSVSIYRPTIGSKKKKRKGGVWWMAWRDEHTKKQIRRSTKAREKSVAKQIARDMERKLLLDPYGLTAKTPKPIRWCDLRDEFVEHSRLSNRPATADAYALSLKHFDEVVGSRHVHEVDVAMLQNFVQVRRKKTTKGEPISVATVNKDLRAVRAALNFARERGYIESCPSFKSVTLREDRPSPVVISRKDRDKIYAALETDNLELKIRPKEWWFVMLVIIEALGVRRKEALAIRWRDINFDRDEVTIEAASSKGRRHRTLPMTDKLRKSLHDYQTATAEANPDSFVLPWEKNSLRPLYDDWHAIIAKAELSSKKAVLPKHFRSTCGSDLIEAGAPTVVVKDYLGHASVTTTESHYINTGSSLRAASEAREKRDNDHRDAANESDLL